MAKKFWNYVKHPTLLGALLFINYAGNAISFRMVQHSSYIGVATTDFAIAWYGFTMTQYVAKAETIQDKIGYSIGGVLGSLFGLWFSVHIGK